jgi:hypothetical protein
MIDVEDINEIPEKFRADYVEVKEGDKTLWRNKAFSALKEVNEKLKGKFTTASEKASAYDKLQEDLEAKRVKDEADRIAGLHDKKDYKGLLDELQQKYADLEKRAGETQKQFDERVGNLQSKISTKAVESTIADLSELATDDGKKSFKRLVKDRIKYDPETEKYTFLDEDGGATSLDLAGFKREIENSDMYAPLLKAKVSVGGFGRNATKGTGGADQNSKLSPTARIDAARAKQNK